MSNTGRVLVVEDNEPERKALGQLLKSEGFTVFGAESADKAMGYVDENLDVVLSDHGRCQWHRFAPALEKTPA
jgi:CheY-like chemotaxis protein